MVSLGELVELRTVVGETQTIDGIRVTPESQAFSVRWPHGGFVWHRPVAVVVEQDGVESRMRIPDVTRLMQLGLLLLMAAGLGLVGWSVRKHR